MHFYEMYCVDKCVAILTEGTYSGVTREGQFACLLHGWAES